LPVAGVITSISPWNFHQLSDAIFSTSFAHALRNRFSIYFDSGFAVRREISKIILLLIVMWLIECCLN